MTGAAASIKGSERDLALKTSANEENRRSIVAGDGPLSPQRIGLQSYCTEAFFISSQVNLDKLVSWRILKLA